MATIFVPVEVPDDKLSEFLGAAGLSVPSGAVVQPPQSYTPPWQDAPSVAPQAPVQPPQQQSDPWAQQQPTPTQPAFGGQQQSQAQQYAQPATAVAQQQAPMCPHGPRKYVPNGVSQRTNKPYPAFWACQAAQNDPSKCRTIPA